jgi:hypothetical protein
MIGALEDLTVAQLENRAAFHASTAEMFESNGVVGTAKTFRELAATYRKELERRQKRNELDVPCLRE